MIYYYITVGIEFIFYTIFSIILNENNLIQINCLRLYGTLRGYKFNLCFIQKRELNDLQALIIQSLKCVSKLKLKKKKN